MNTLILSRLQFAVTTIFHMLWPLLSIGISLTLVGMEILWLRTRQDEYYRQVRFWSKIFLVVFGIGVASGVPLEFQFGTNWSRFSIASGDLFGNILAFEASMSFALEAAFLAVFIFGWNRVSRGMHLFSNIMVAFGASLSAFWIMGANSWMQVPAGVKYAGGKIMITDYFRAVFNPGLPVAFSHIWFASVETSLFFMAGISAWFILRKRNVEFFLKAFKVALVMGIVAAPLQIFLGDQSGLSVLAHQPAKAAAMEAWWSTNPPGTSAPWSVVAWPDKAAQANKFSFDIPYALSLLAARRLKGQVTGLRDFPVDEQPPIVLPYYSFRLMVLLGFFMLALVIWAVVEWARGRLKPENAARRTTLWKLWLFALPTGFIAAESGWVLREVGRQPWIIYGLMRTSDGVSPIAAGSAAATLAVFSAAYLALLVLFIVLTRRIMDKGPDLSSPVPPPSPRPVGSSAGGSSGR